MLNAPSVNAFGARGAQYPRGSAQPQLPQSDTSWRDAAVKFRAGTEAREQGFNSDLGALQRQGVSSLGDVLTGITSAQANVGSNAMNTLGNNASAMAEYKLGRQKISAAKQAADAASNRALMGTIFGTAATAATLGFGGFLGPAAAAGGGTRFAGDALGSLGFKLAGQGISLG